MGEELIDDIIYNIYMVYPSELKDVEYVFHKTRSIDRTIVIIRLASELDIGLEAAFKLNEIALHGDKTQLNRYGRDIEYFTNLII